MSSPDCDEHRQHLLAYLRRPIEPHLLYLAAKWGIADALRDGPRPSATLAVALGLDVAILHRLLRGMVAMGLFAEADGGAFALAPRGELLLSDVPDSVRGDVIFISELNFAWQALPYAARAGTSPFRMVYGGDPFSYFGNDPATREAFYRQMAAGGRAIVAAVLTAYDFARFHHVVDVGGGHGALLAAILQVCPDAAGVLFDLPTAIAGADAPLVAAGVRDRCTLIGGDFFASVPAGGDCYILERILHDWDDGDAARILANCRAAVAVGGTLLVIEKIMPQRVTEAPNVVLSDLIMLVETGGRERTQAEFATLLSATGFAVTRAIATGAGVAIIEAVAVERTREYGC
jgi:hypothetical protein